jgi:hypothetical protein
MYGEFKATIKINDFALLEGYLPPKAFGLVIEWASIHKNELLNNWNLAMENKRISKIEPLE